VIGPLITVPVHKDVHWASGRYTSLLVASLNTGATSIASPSKN
jgi:hypothetical protein